MKKRLAQSTAPPSKDAAVMSALGKNLPRNGWDARTLRSRAAESANREPQLNPVPSCPAKMLERIEVAKRSIAQDKARAVKQGREYAPVFYPLGFTDTAVAIFERLAGDANMEHVWQTLTSMFDDTRRLPDTWAFADFCYQTIGVWEHSPKRTRAEHKRYFQQIADDLTDVASRVVCEPEFGAIGSIGATVSPLEMVGDDMLEWLLEAMNADPIDGKIIKTQKGAVGYLRFSLAEVIPDLFSYAEWMAATARRIAMQPSIGGRPHRDTAHRTFFIKHLSKWFRDHFGRPMHEVVAGVASALFDEAVTADTVRKAVQSEPDVSIPFRHGKLPLPE